MNLFIYGLSALLTLLLAVRRLQALPEEPGRDMGASLARLSVLVAGIWLCFAGFLVLDSEVFRILRGLLSLAVPFALAQFLDALLGPDRPRLRWPGREGPQAVPAPYVLGAIYLGMSVAGLTWPWLRHPSEVLLGGSVVILLAVEGLQIRRLQRRMELPLEQARARNLLVLMLVPVGWVLIEALGRLPGQSAGAGEGWLLRAVEVQGVIPPIGAIITTGTLFLLTRAVNRRRMLDLDEILQAVSEGASRMAPLSAAAATLGAVTLFQVGPQLPGRSALQAAMVVVLAVAATDPFRTQLEHLLVDRFNQRGQRLREAVAHIHHALARVISLDGLADEVLERLVRSGRISTASLYLWEPESGACRLQSRRGQPVGLASMSTGPLNTFGTGPLSPGPLSPLTPGPPRRALVRPWLRLEAQRRPERQEELAPILRLLDGLAADALLPLSTGSTTPGWLCLRDGDGGGFSEEEIALLQRLADRVTVLLENVYDFERLKEVNRLAALGTMAAGLAHEIRNPLAGIKGAAQYIQSDTGPPDPDMIQVIVDEVDRLNTVVTQFLDYARPLQLQREPTRIDALIAQVATLFRAQGISGVQWVEDHAPDLPPARIDAPRIKQVLLNLCQNGIQAMKANKPEGGPPGTLRIRTRPGHLHDPRGQSLPCVEISVEDTGCGIAPEDLPQLFVPFFTRRHDGTGLGLAVCQRIVQAHQGTIDVHSTPGQGAVFTVKLLL